MNYELRMKLKILIRCINLIKLNITFRIFLSTVILIFSNIILKAQNPDTELWTGFSIDFPIIDNFSIEPSEQFRFDKDLSKLNSAISDLSLKYRINKFFKLATTYRLYVRPKLPNHAIYFSGYFNYEIKPIDFTYKLTYKKKFEEDNKTQEHIRNKITIEYKAAKWLKPFVAYELFYRFNYKRVTDSTIIDSFWVVILKSIKTTKFSFIIYVKKKLI